jgi:hypothetical protein
MGQRFKRFRSAVTGLFVKKDDAARSKDTHTAESVPLVGRQLTSAERRTAQVLASQAFHEAESTMRVVGVVRQRVRYAGFSTADGVKVKVTIEVEE